MTYLHIWRTETQPATSFLDHCVPGEPLRRTLKPNALVWCMCCGKARRAANAVVQVFYDGERFFCAPAKGCKDPALLAQKRRREFRNRSRGNKAAWARRSAPLSHATKG